MQSLTRTDPRPSARPPDTAAAPVPADPHKNRSTPGPCRTTSCSPLPRHAAGRETRASRVPTCRAGSPRATDGRNKEHGSPPSGYPGTVCEDHTALAQAGIGRIGPIPRHHSLLFSGASTWQCGVRLFVRGSHTLPQSMCSTFILPHSPWTTRHPAKRARAKQATRNHACQCVALFCSPRPRFRASYALAICFRAAPARPKLEMFWTAWPDPKPQELQRARCEALHGRRRTGARTHAHTHGVIQLAIDWHGSPHCHHAPGSSSKG